MEPDSSVLPRIEELAPGSPPEVLAQARGLLLEYGRFVLAQRGSARFCFGALEDEAARLPLSFQEQGGGCLLAWNHDTPAGFVAWRVISAAGLEKAWEMKRLWVQPAARGLRFGQILIEAVVSRARAAGQEAILLDTDPDSMTAAHRMYLKMGFSPCPPYRAASEEGLVYLRKLL